MLILLDLSFVSHSLSSIYFPFFVLIFLDKDIFFKKKDNLITIIVGYQYDGSNIEREKWRGMKIPISPMLLFFN